MLQVQERWHACQQLATRRRRFDLGSHIETALQLLVQHAPADAYTAGPFQRDKSIVGSTPLKQGDAVPTSSPSLAAAASAAAGAPLAAAAACPRCRLPPSRYWHATRLQLPPGPRLP